MKEAKAREKDFNNAESAAYIVYDKKIKDYKILIPKQKVSGGTVEYSIKENHDDIIEIIEFHSHNTMDAFFSSVDDINNHRPLIHIVIGKINSFLCRFIL